MRGGINITEAEVYIGEERAEIVGFWITEENYVYVKVKKENDCYTNYRLTKMADYFKISQRKNETHTHIREFLK